jgi:hypothetical protein
MVTSTKEEHLETCSPCPTRKNTSSIVVTEMPKLSTPSVRLSCKRTQLAQLTTVVCIGLFPLTDCRVSNIVAKLRVSDLGSTNDSSLPASDSICKQASAHRDTSTHSLTLTHRCAGHKLLHQPPHAVNITHVGLDQRHVVASTEPLLQEHRRSVAPASKKT